MFKKTILGISAALCLSCGAMANNNPITVYYFHGDIRCVTCNKMENYTKQAIADNFKGNKNIVFTPVNYDKEENKLLKMHYGLYSNSVILADTGNKWKNLDKIWTLAGNEAKFKTYIVDEVNQFTGTGK